MIGPGSNKNTSCFEFAVEFDAKITSTCLWIELLSDGIIWLKFSNEKTRWYFYMHMLIPVLLDSTKMKSTIWLKNLDFIFFYKDCHCPEVYTKIWLKISGWRWFDFSLSRLQGQRWASACREILQENAGKTEKMLICTNVYKNISKMGVRWVSWSGMCAWCTLEQSTLALVLYPWCARVSTEKPRGTSLERGCAMCAAVPQFSLLWPHGHSWTGQGGGKGGPHPSRQDWGAPGPPHKAHNGQPSVQWLQAGGSSASKEGSGSLWELNQVASGGGGRLEGAGLGRPPLHHGRVLLLPSSGRHPPSPGHPDNTLYLNHYEQIIVDLVYLQQQVWSTK